MENASYVIHNADSFCAPFVNKVCRLCFTFSAFAFLFNELEKRLHGKFSIQGNRQLLPPS